MPRSYHEAVTKTAVSKSALEVVLPPRDLGEYARRALTFAVADGDGKLGLADATVEVGPTATGPWLAVSLSGLGVTNLAAGATAAVRMDLVDRWLRASAKGADNTGQTDLTIYLDAMPINS
jgi:hypothetical protein